MKHSWTLMAVLCGVGLVALFVSPALAQCQDRCNETQYTDIYFCNGWFYDWCIEVKYPTVKQLCGSYESGTDCTSHVVDDDMVKRIDYHWLYFILEGQSGYYCQLTVTGAWVYAGPTEPPTGEGEVFITCTFQEAVQCGCASADPPYTRVWDQTVCVD